MSERCPKCGSVGVVKTPLVIRYDCETRLLLQDMTLVESRQCQQRQIARLEQENAKLTAALHADSPTMPCGHAARWQAACNPVDYHSERYCLFCKIERLTAALRRFAVESKWRKEHTETRFATSEVEWCWQFAESPCEIARQALGEEKRDALG